MSKDLKKAKSALIFNIVIMLLGGIYGLFTIVHNEPFNHNGEMLIMSTSMQIKATIGLLLGLSTIVYALYLTIKLINNISVTKLFHSDNIKLMEKAAFSIGIYGLTSALGISSDFAVNAGFLKEIIANGTLSTSGISLNFSINVLAIISIVSIIVTMVELIKDGIRLKEENDLTV